MHQNPLQIRRESTVKLSSCNVLLIKYQIQLFVVYSASWEQIYHQILSYVTKAIHHPPPSAPLPSIEAQLE